ncbi:CubicO group peptidase (beta-lactamase class C family) [Kribbella sp. VKM Ac-2571]|uniref:serine hydrolase domain-containing protein n=1 Tax=Kribbella sp. VKM Ac-2571 TaxID=2512222 RepID=UPI001061F1FC|nr:serine hydrolase domain-containing protein [Kribbella sp. VKM Ac-2571]TDO46097.1 CubicO group peptidase (beta-lactamase class C family) [Kribbella sp. VKM Ac-2571]
MLNKRVLRRRVAGLLEQHRVPGIAVGICDRKSMLWSAGFGRTRAGGGESVTPQTMFGVQSCSKMYTATAVLLAVRDGLVDLDVPIVEYLPEIRLNSSFETRPERVITLRHLLRHTAGFTHEAPVGSNYLVGRGSFEAHCRSIYDTWLRFPVGHHFQYSNLGIDLAGYILQRRSGLPFDRFVRRTVFEPLGLTRTTFNAAEIQREKDRAIGHSPEYSRIPVRVPMVAAGGLYTTVNDACRFIQFQLAGGADLAELHRLPGRDRGYGLGLRITDVDGIPVHGHGGGGFGFLSDIYWAPDAGVGVVVLTNSTEHSLQWELASEIFREVIPHRPPREVPAPPEVSPGSLTGLAGNYSGSGTDQVTFAVEGDRGVLVQGDTRHPVRFVGPLEFTIGQGERLRFRDLDDAGRPAYLERVDDGHVRFRNDVPEAPPTKPTEQIEPPRPDGPWNRDYAVRANGVREGTARLRKENGVHLFDHWHGGTVRLRRHRRDLYISATGEALDLTCTPPTYANIRLHGL